MRNKIRKFSALVITISILLSISIFVLANPNRFGDFTGNNHGSCHGDFGLGTGSISNVSSSGGTVDPNEIFTISLQINGFSEAAGSELKLGFPSGNPGRGDNTQFTFNTTRESVTLDGSGNSGIIDYQVTAPLTEQTYNLVADAMYTESNSGPSWFITLSVAIKVQSTPSDTTPPEVVIINPNNNEYVKGDLLIYANVDDIGGSGVNTVWAEITNVTNYNETILMSPDVSTFYNVTWDSTSVFDGTYTITVLANDSASPSNLNDTESVFINVDNTPPSITLDSVLPDPSNGLTTIVASNSSSDIDGNGIWATVETPSAQSIHVDLTYQGGNLWNGTFTITENGLYTVNINATDNVGNTAYAGPSINTGDVKAPQLYIENPSKDGDQLGGSIISISGTAFGTGSNIQSVYINDSRWGISNQPQTDPSGSTNGAFIFNNNTNIPIGNYWVAINITDQAGNVNTSYRYFIVVDFDITPPILLITSINPNPSNGFTEIYVTSTEDLITPPQLNITAPNATVFYRPMRLINTLTWNANYTVKDTGTYIVQVNGTDLNSNVGYVSTSFIGDVTDPTISIVNILPNPSNGLTTITVFNSSSDIDGNGIWATVETPSAQFIHVDLIYQGGNLWNGTFVITENGLYTVNINATDFAGNTGYDGPVIITGDVEAPIITIDNILPNPSSGLTVILVSNSSSDINGNGIWATVETPSAQFIHVVLIYQGGNLWNGTFTVTENGLYTVNINATDYAGNTGYMGPLNINGDVSAPTIFIISPQQNTPFGISAPTFNITIVEVNLHSTWYSLFNGTTWSNNMSFTGSVGTIQQALWNSMPDDTIIIRFYANDTFGKTGISQINILKDTVKPIININSPIENEEFRSNAPTFSLSVVDQNLKSSWYSLFDGVSWSSNISFTGSMGTIQQALWDSMPDGIIMIRFYADDIVGHIGFKDVNITKDTTPLNQNGGSTDEIEIFNIIIAVGTIGVISAIFIFILVRMRTKRFIK